MKGKAISKVSSCLVVFAILMSVFSVAVIATDSANSAASNVTDEANSSEEPVALSNNNNITCLTCCNGLISNTSSPGIINESAEVPDPDLPVINDTDIDATKTVSAMSSCSYVWIKITDKYCKGYKVYVDGVYQFTEGEGGVPDGYCCFKVTPGYHTFKLTLNGKEVSKGWNCQCGHVYNWVSMNDMIPHWCEDDGNDNPTDEYEVKFQGTVTSTTPSEYYCGFKDVYICEVKIEKVVFDDYFEKGDIVNIVYSQWRENAHACGTYDKVSVGDTVEVYGEMIPIYCVGTWITICGKNSYYLKKIDSKTLSINVWTDKSEYEIGETVTIYYQTNKKCTAKLTVTKPDGTQVVVGGPNEIPACTRSKSATIGYPTGRRTVVFEAWAGDEYKKATCYFDVVEELVCDVTFEGVVTDIYNKYDPHYYDANIKVTRVIDDPSGTLYVGRTVTVKRTNEDAYEDAVNVGDMVEVHAGYDTRYSFYGVGRWEDYIKKLPEEKKPDLIIQDIYWSPSNPKEGDTVTFTVKTKNQGSENAGGFYVCYYVDGSYYDRDYVNSLSAGSTTTTSFSWTADCGSHSIKAVADCYDAVTESNEGNNARTEYINIVCKPDLVVQDISWDKGSPKRGDTITFYVEVKNQGSGSAGSSTVKYYIDGSYVGSDTVPSLSLGSTSTQTFTWKANKCGNVKVKAVADATNIVDESNEGNNEGTVTVSIECPKPKNHPYISKITLNRLPHIISESAINTIDIEELGTCWGLPESLWAYVQVTNPVSKEVVVRIKGQIIDKHGEKVLERIVPSPLLSSYTIAPGDSLTANVRLQFNSRLERFLAGRIGPGNYTLKFMVEQKKGFVQYEKVDEKETSLIVMPKEEPTVEYPKGDWDKDGINEPAPGIEYTLFKKREVKVADLLENVANMVWLLVQVKRGIMEPEPLPWHGDFQLNGALERAAASTGEIYLKEEDQGEYKILTVLWGNAKYKEPDWIGYAGIDYDRAVVDLILPSTIEVIDDGDADYHIEKEGKIQLTWIYNAPDKQLRCTYPGTALSNKPVKPYTVKVRSKSSVTQQMDVKAYLRLEVGPLRNQIKHYIEYPITNDVEEIAVIYDYDAWQRDPNSVYWAVIGSRKYKMHSQLSEQTALFVECPVNVTITDQRGREVSDSGINEIPDATVLIKDEKKAFYLPADLTYSVDIEAYDSGTFNFTRLSPFGNNISITKFENIPVTSSTKASVEIEPGVIDYTMSIDYDGDGETDEEKSPDVNETIIVTPTEENIFDTGSPSNPYPSIAGTHTGTITPNRTITVNKLYTYPCAGTGGHTESIELYDENGNLIASGNWNGYQQGDWHNITITPSVTLLKDNVYRYIIKTGSYPQIIHTKSKDVTGGTITCDEFIDANGKVYYDWIPAIILE